MSARPSGVVSRRHCQDVTSVPWVCAAAIAGLGYHSGSRRVEPRGCGMLAIDMARMSGEGGICGAGIAGVAAADHLAGRRGVRDVVRGDERPPPTLTSGQAAEWHPNLWPGAGA